DLDHVGAEHGEEVGDERPRPEHREIEHAKPGEGQGPAVSGRRYRRRGPPGVVLAEPRRGREGAERTAPEPIRDPRLHEVASRGWHVDAPLAELLERRYRHAGADGGHRDAEER